MRPRRDYTFSSSIAPMIEGHITERRASGFMYNSAADVLKEFDTFCIENGFHEDTVTKEMADAWSIQRVSEGINSRNIRVSILRQLSKYILSLGLEAYMPPNTQSGEIKVSHVFSEKERLEFFAALDSLKTRPGKYGGMILEECKVIFRMYYSRMS